MAAADRLQAEQRPALPPGDSASLEDPSAAAPSSSAGPGAVQAPAKDVSKSAQPEKDVHAAEGDDELAELENGMEGQARLEGVARLASQAQPKGHTLDSAGVHVKVECAPQNLYYMLLNGFCTRCPTLQPFELISLC